MMQRDLNLSYKITSSVELPNNFFKFFRLIYFNWILTWSRIMTFITFKEKWNTHLLPQSATDQTSPAVIWKILEIKHVKWWPSVKIMVTRFYRCISKTLHRCLNWEAVALIVFCLPLVYPLFRDFGWGSVVSFELW